MSKYQNFEMGKVKLILHKYFYQSNDQMQVDVSKAQNQDHNHFHVSQNKENYFGS